MILSRWSASIVLVPYRSRNTWLVSSRLAVRNGRRRPSSWCSLSPANHRPGQDTAYRYGSPATDAAVPGAAPRYRSARAACRRRAKVLSLAGRFALDVEKLGPVRHRVDQDHEFRRQLQRQQRLSARRQLDRFEEDILEQFLEIIRDIDARAPEHLTEILAERQFVRVVRRDPAHPATDRERHFDDLVEGRRVTGRTPGTGVFVLVDALQRGAAVEHAAAARAQHVPRQFENAEPRRMQKSGNCPLLIEPGLPGKIQHVDPAQGTVRSIPNQRLDRLGTHRDRRIAAEPQTDFWLRSSSRPTLSYAARQAAASVRPGIGLPANRRSDVGARGAAAKSRRPPSSQKATSGGSRRRPDHTIIGGPVTNPPQACVGVGCARRRKARRRTVRGDFAPVFTPAKE